MAGDEVIAARSDAYELDLGGIRVVFVGRARTNPQKRSGEIRAVMCGNLGGPE